MAAIIAWIQALQTFKRQSGLYRITLFYFLQFVEMQSLIDGLLLTPSSA